MTLKESISFALEASLFGLVMSYGLHSRLSDITHVLRRPGMLLRATLAVNVVVPAAAILLCVALPIEARTKAGIVAMALSPLAPFAPLKMLKAGADRSFVIGTYVVLMIAAVVIIPASAAVLKPLATSDVNVPVPVIAAFVIQTVLVPVTTGIAISAHWPRLADSAAPLVRRVSLVILIPVALLMLARFAGNFADSVGDGTLAAIAAIVAVGIAAGYAFGGPDPASREALGDAAATRHPGLAATIAQLNSSDDRVLTAIVLYLFASIGFSLVYAWLISRAKALPIKGGERPHP